MSVNVNLPLPVVSPTDFGDEDTEMVRYKDEGTARALAMDNRSPVRFGSGGKLNPAILDSYWKHGFYVFENVVSAEERKNIERDVAEIIERAPIFPNSKLDKHGRPAFGHDGEGRGYRLPDRLKTRSAARTAIKSRWRNPAHPRMHRNGSCRSC